MPRLTHAKYCEHRSFLQDAWRLRQGVFADFRTDEQWLLHLFFAATKALSDTELRSHRIAVTNNNPSTPHSAGKLMLRFHEAYHQQLLHEEKMRRRGSGIHIKGARRKVRKIDVRSVVIPEVDINSFIRAVRSDIRRN